MLDKTNGTELLAKEICWVSHDTCTDFISDRRLFVSNRSAIAISKEIHSQSASQPVSQPMGWKCMKIMLRCVFHLLCSCRATTNIHKLPCAVLVFFLSFCAVNIFLLYRCCQYGRIQKFTVRHRIASKSNSLFLCSSFWYTVELTMKLVYSWI